MITVGMMIAERYEIIEKIGTGGMSDVYRAKDHKLNRFVAVKVLKQEFSENTDFVSKFRVEAQAAAGLMHPNIVNVYDVGEENGFHYIVMELVEGITLKKYIEKKARLSVKEAVSIGIQVSMGIEAAHNNHIIHRDIKPQNIIISKEGKVKVTDFGIAKAATSNTITSNVMGSVHYTSPEQVRGGFSDEKSDIYSLGITLFEMLTGRVPFNGETTVAVAIKHIQEAMPTPRQFVPEIPVSVEQIVLKCTQKSPDRRYQSAPELIEDLKKSLISPDENFVKIDNGEYNGVTKNITQGELDTIRSQTRQRDVYEEQLAQGSKKNLERQNTANNRKSLEKARALAMEDPGDTEEIEPQKKKKASATTGKTTGKKPSKQNTTKKSTRKKSVQKEEEYDPKMELLTTILVVVAAIIIGCVFLYVVAMALGINLLSPSNTDNGNAETQITSELVIMPDVIGKNGDQVTEALENAGLVVEKIYQESSEVPENMIISSSVQTDAQINKGSTVTLYISSGTNGALLPDVSNKSKAEATATLENEGFKVNVLKENSSEIVKDNVIRQEPAGGATVARGATVTLYVSLGTEAVPVTMPSILGKTEDEAIAILTQSGLNPVAGEGIYSDTYTAGLVTYQSYSQGVTINSGTDVEYRVSLGVEQVYYNCNYTVQAPSDYSGGDAQIVLKGMDGSQLFATTTNTFPVDINVSNIFAVPLGEVYITYNVNKTEEITDAEGNVTVQTVQVQNTSGPLSVTFTKVQ